MDLIVSSIRDLARFGFDSASLALDFFPLAEADDHYFAIFEELKRLNIALVSKSSAGFCPALHFLRVFANWQGRIRSLRSAPIRKMSNYAGRLASTATQIRHWKTVSI